jgi:uncharacterized protein YjaG (DUF416 family)
LTAFWGTLESDRQQRLIVRYTPETAEALCEHFGWKSEAFCSQTDLQNARVFNQLLDIYFPDLSTYYRDIEPYIDTLLSVSRDCSEDSSFVRFGIGYCPPPEECQMETKRTEYVCSILLPSEAGEMVVRISGITGQIIHLYVGESSGSL